MSSASEYLQQVTASNPWKMGGLFDAVARYEAAVTPFLANFCGLPPDSQRDPQYYALTSMGVTPDELLTALNWQGSLQNGAARDVVLDLYNQAAAAAGLDAVDGQQFSALATSDDPEEIAGAVQERDLLKAILLARGVNQDNAQYLMAYLTGALADRGSEGGVVIPACELDLSFTHAEALPLAAEALRQLGLAIEPEQVEAAVTEALLDKIRFYSEAFAGVHPVILDDLLRDQHPEQALALLKAHNLWEEAVTKDQDGLLGVVRPDGSIVVTAAELELTQQYPRTYGDVYGRLDKWVLQQAGLDPDSYRNDLAALTSNW